MGLRTGVDVQIARAATPVEFTATLTSVADGTASATVTLGDNAWLTQVEVKPDTGGTAPTAFTTLTVKNARGTDLLSGAGAGTVVNANTIFRFDPPIWTASPLTVAATGMGDSKVATVYVAVL